MTLPTHIADRLTALGISAEVKGSRVVTDIDGITSTLRFDDDMQGKFEAYRRARRSIFDTADWSYIRNSTVEVPLARLDPDVYRDTDETNFSDQIGNTVTVQRATFEYMLAHFDSIDYVAYFDRLVKLRLTRYQSKYLRNVNILFRAPVTATYTAQGRKSPENLHQLGLERIRSCLMGIPDEREQRFRGT